MNLMNGEGIVLKLVVAAVLLLLLGSLALAFRSIDSATSRPYAPLVCENSVAVPSVELGETCR